MILSQSITGKWLTWLDVGFSMLLPQAGLAGAARDLTCRRDFNDRPRLASQHAQMRHISLSTAGRSESRFFGKVSLTEGATFIAQE